MRTTQKTVLLVALLAGAFAAPTQSIKNRLGQVNAKNLAQAQYNGNGVGNGTNGGYLDCDVEAMIPNFTLPTLPFVECPCVFNPLPGVGAAEQTGLQQRLQQSSVLAVQQIPDTAFSQICRSNCCECA